MSRSLKVSVPDDAWAVIIRKARLRFGRNLRKKRMQNKYGKKMLSLMLKEYLNERTQNSSKINRITK